MAATFHYLSLTEIKPNERYTLQMLCKNENGWSPPSEKFQIHIAKPPVPEKFRASSKRSDSLIKVRWNIPEVCLIANYEILKRNKKGTYGKAVEIPGNKLSATFINLRHNTQYFFKIRACNGQQYTSSWTKEIEANTRISKFIKGAASPMVFAAGTITAPILTTVTGGAACGLLGHEEGGKIGAVAAGTAGTLGGAAVGIIGAPVIGAATAHLFVHGLDLLSEQSDDEDAVIIKN